MKKQNHIIKIIALTVVTLLIALVIELTMFSQHGIAVISQESITTLVLMIIVAIIVTLLAVADWHFSNYATIAAMMYYGIISLGGLLQVKAKSSVSGLLIQLLAIIGIVLCVFGIVLGVKQRELFMQKKYREERREIK